MDFAKLELQAIGVVDSCYPDKFGTPRQPGLVAQSQARIRFRADVQAELALQGLENYSHVWLLFWFHLNQNARYHAKVHPPRLGGETMGLFATRSPHRPNPIGLSLVEIEKIENDILYVRGVDLVQDTPILDIKPYLPSVECKPAATEGWVAPLQDLKIAIEWSPDAHEQFATWWEKSKNFFVRALSKDQLQELVQQTLALDPRPIVYRGYENSESPYRSDHAVRIHDGDIHFRFLSSERIQVFKVVSTSL